MNNHYIYAFLEPGGTDIPRYIGQGKGNRFNWWKYNKSESQYGVYPWLNSLRRKRKEPIVIFVASNLTKEEANEYEVDLIEFIGRVSEKTGPLLNLAPGGKNGGAKMSVETKRKMSKALKGVPHNKKWVEKIADANRGKRRGPRSVELIQKIADANRGKKRSKETCRKIGDAHRGKTISKATRDKMAAAKIGNKINLGRACSEATKQKIGAKLKGRKANENQRTALLNSRTGSVRSEATRRKIAATEKETKRKKRLQAVGATASDTDQPEKV